MPSNRFLNQRIRKKIYDKRKKGIYYKKRNKDKSKQINKQFTTKKRQNIIKNVRYIHKDIYTNSKEQNISDGNNANFDFIPEYSTADSHFHKNLSLDWNKFDVVEIESLLDCFDRCYLYFGIEPSRNLSPFWCRRSEIVNPPSYNQYLYNVPKQYHFSSNVSQFGRLLYECFCDMFYSNYEWIYASSNRYTDCKNVFLAGLLKYIQDLVLWYYNYQISNASDFTQLLFNHIADFNCSDWGESLDNYGAYLRCYHCDDCQGSKTKAFHSIWDIFCYDLESCIIEMKKEIETIQYNDMNMINEYNKIHTIQNWSQYLSDVINIHGISAHICYVILQFTAFEYPCFFSDEFDDIEYCLEISEKKLQQNHFIENLHLFSNSSCWINLLVNIHDFPKRYKIGQFYYKYHHTINYRYFCVCFSEADNYDDVYIDDDTIDILLIEDKWIDLWNKLILTIENNIIKIGCYKSIWNNVQKQIIENKSIAEIIEEKLNINTGSDSDIIIKQLEQVKSEQESQMNIFDNKQKLKYYNKIIAERKDSIKWIKQEIKSRNNSNTRVRKCIFKTEKKERKLKFMEKIAIRDKLRKFMWYKNAHFLVYGLLRRNANNLGLTITPDVVQLILAMYCS
eukprot:343535_1